MRTFFFLIGNDSPSGNNDKSDDGVKSDEQRKIFTCDQSVEIPMMCGKVIDLFRNKSKINKKTSDNESEKVLKDHHPKPEFPVVVTWITDKKLSKVGDCRQNQTAGQPSVIGGDRMIVKCRHKIPDLKKTKHQKGDSKMIRSDGLSS